MKRILCLLCCILLMLTLSFPASAVIPSQDQHPVQDNYSVSEIRALGTAIFPEYAHKINSVPSFSAYQASAKGTTDSVVISITREVSPELSVNYTEFASGINSVTTLTSRIETVSSESNGALTRKTINLVVTVSGSNQTATWHNVKCIFAFNDHDNISDVGRAITNGTTANYMTLLNDRKLVENASGPAYLKFNGQFMIFYSTEDEYESSYDIFNFTARLNVGNDKATFRITSAS